MIREQPFSFPLITFTSLIGIVAVLLIAAIFMANDTYEFIRSTMEKNQMLIDVRENIILYDEVLTMSASMAARTGNTTWIERYNKYELILKDAIRDAISLTTDEAVQLAITTTHDANDLLVDLEQRSFDFVRDGDIDSAWKILSSDEYKQQKKIYSAGIAKATEILKTETSDYLKSIRTRLLINLIGSIVAFAIMIIILLVVWRIVKKWQQLQSFHQEELKELATHDVLTGIPNRALLIELLTQAIAQESRRHSALAVVFIDLDGFKAVNDQYGHSVGDALLIRLAKRLQKVIREGDSVSRFGGDEFVVVMIDINGHNALMGLLDRIVKAMNKPVQIESYDIQVTASLGVTIFEQEYNVEPEQLIRQADHAMYEAKKTGKNQYKFFSDNES